MVWVFMAIIVVVGAMMIAAVWLKDGQSWQAVARQWTAPSDDVLPPQAIPLADVVVIHLYDRDGRLRHEVNIHHKADYEFPATYSYAGVVYGYVDRDGGFGRYRAG